MFSPVLSDPKSLSKFQGFTCSNDTHFYQACDKRLHGKVTNDEVLCEKFLCKFSRVIWTSDLLTGFGGPCSFPCENTDINKKGCEERTVTLPTGTLAHPDDLCNDICDALFCEDEASCNGYFYGAYCTMSHSNDPVGYIPVSMICDGHEFCLDGKDEENCRVTEIDTHCRHRFTGEMVPVHNNTRCASLDTTGDIENKWSNTQSYCKREDIAYYQSNCSDPARVALTCKINGYQSTVSKYLVCFDEAISACDDQIDSKCFKTKSCKVHKHFMCDGKIDCDDESDETHSICSSTTEATCKRRVGGRDELPIPISWLQDGTRDCENGADEFANWPKCGVGKTLRYISRLEKECENVFICRTGSPGYELPRNLCDGLESCGNENEICSVSSMSQMLITTVLTTNKGQTKKLSYCLKGLFSLEMLMDTCIMEQFIYPNEAIFGVEKTSVILPQDKRSCEYMFGEHYLYTSCTGRCKGASCPLRSIPRYEVCPNQLPNRVGTIVNNQYLIFLTKSHGLTYSNRHFVCDNKITCIDYSKVCDLVEDCEDGSDEDRCTNHFKCNSSGKLLPKTKKCDGHIDCEDISDECNGQCSKSLLEGAFLKGLAWIIGFLAIVANLVIIGKSVSTLRRCRTTAALINRLLIILIALGDLLIGCYLVVIATYDAFIFKKGYCKRQVSWITSHECSVIGVLSTIGSQISLFSMTGLSLVRIHGIWNSMSIPGEVNLMKSLKIAAAMMFLAIGSATIAFIPVVDGLEDYFVNGLKFSKGLKIFTGTPDKSTLLKVIQAYHGRTEERTLRWKTMIAMVREMFSHDLDYEDLTTEVATVDFYGNDGVCLFKYFVHNEDPQKFFVGGILFLNFICFVFISISYLFIGILSRGSSNSLASSQNNQQITQRNRRLNQRIAIIITTDFLCWVPFIVICILHFLEVIDATPWYSIFSMVILPINSVINPFLYDSVVTDVIRALFSRLPAPIFDFTFINIRQRQNHSPTEAMNLDELEAHVVHNTTACEKDRRMRRRDKSAPVNEEGNQACPTETHPESLETVDIIAETNI